MASLDRLLFLGCLGVALASCAAPMPSTAPPALESTLLPTATPIPPVPDTPTPLPAPSSPTPLPATTAPLPATALPPPAPTAATPTQRPAAPPGTLATAANPPPTAALRQAATLPAATLQPAAPATAAAPPLAPGATAQAVIRIDGAFARSAPSLTAPRAFPVFDGNRLMAAGRTTDGNWVAVVSPGGATGWLLHPYVAVEAGFDGLPATPATPLAPPVQASFPAYLSLPAPARQRFRAAIGAGRDGRVFTVAGACNSEAYAFVRRVATGLYDTSGMTALHGAVTRFAPSFTRVSMAARGGYTVGSLFDPDWVEPGVCPLGEGPLACELRQTNASIIFVELGTGDQFGWKDFEPHYREIVDYALQAGALPVLVTKADDLDHQQGGSPEGFINDVIRRVAAERQLPLIDFHAATRSLPNFGLLDEGNFDFHLSPAGSDLHLQATLQMLNALIQ